MEKHYTFEQVKEIANTAGKAETVFGKSGERLMAEDTLILYSEIHELNQEIEYLKEENKKNTEALRLNKIHIDDLLSEIRILRSDIQEHMQKFHNSTTHIAELETINQQMVDKIRTFKKR